VLLLQGEAGSPFELIARDLAAISIFRDGPVMVCAAHEFGTERLLEVLAPTLLSPDAGTLVITGVETFTPAQQKILQTLLASRDMFLPFARRFRAVLAATNHLADLADSGQFNDTLYYKISALTVSVPPLRELRPDLLANARQILDQHAAATKSAQPFALTPAAAAWIEAQPWPGNYSQLARTLRAAAQAGTPIDQPALAASLAPAEEPAAVCPVRQTRSPFAPKPAASAAVPAPAPAVAPAPVRREPAPVAAAVAGAPVATAAPRVAKPLTARGLFGPAPHGYNFAQRLQSSLAAAELAAHG
jgi:DNA-binding NtrC family response regulator